MLAAIDKIVASLFFLGLSYKQSLIMRLHFFLAIALCLIAQCSKVEAGYDRRFFDFTPISTTNPAVAQIDNSIEIPTSEYVAYQKAEHLATVKDKLDLNQKKEILNELIDQYLLVDDAYKVGADKQPGFIHRMEFTKTLILSDMLVARDVDAKAKTAEQYNELLTNLQERLLDETEIDISNEAYDQLKAMARGINSAGDLASSPEEQKDAAREKTREIMQHSPDAVLARYDGKSLTVKQVLAVYAQLHIPRPNLENQSVLTDFLKPFIVPDLLSVEAQKEGMDKSQEFQDKVLQNQNALLRIYMRNKLEAEADDKLQTSDLDVQMESWYDQHKDQYARQVNGKNEIPSYAEMRKRVQGDYSEDLLEHLQAKKIQTLRSTHEVRIDDTVLDRL
jgi:hypothetical protein